MSLMLKLLVVLVLLFVQPVSAEEGLIQLLDPLDEPEFYCLDVPGWGNRLNLDAPLMAHTCKPGAADEMFTIGSQLPTRLFMQAYDRCVEAGSAQQGSELFMERCSDSKLQGFLIEEKGHIRLTGTELCLVVADGVGTPTNGPSHVRRNLSLESCNGTTPNLSIWKTPARD